MPSTLAEVSQPGEAMTRCWAICVCVVRFSPLPHWACWLKRADARAGVEPKHCRPRGRMRPTRKACMRLPGSWSRSGLRQASNPTLYNLCFDIVAAEAPWREVPSWPSKRLLCKRVARSCACEFEPARLLSPCPHCGSLCPASAARTGAPRQVVRRRVTRWNRGRVGDQTLEKGKQHGEHDKRGNGARIRNASEIHDEHALQIHLGDMHWNF